MPRIFYMHIVISPFFQFCRHFRIGRSIIYNIIPAISHQFLGNRIKIMNYKKSIRFPHLFLTFLRSPGQPPSFQSSLGTASILFSPYFMRKTSLIQKSSSMEISLSYIKLYFV